MSQKTKDLIDTVCKSISLLPSQIRTLGQLDYETIHKAYQDSTRGNVKNQAAVFWSNIKRAIALNPNQNQPQQSIYTLSNSLHSPNNQEALKANLKSRIGIAEARIKEGRDNPATRKELRECSLQLKEMVREETIRKEMAHASEEDILGATRISYLEEELANWKKNIDEYSPNSSPIGTDLLNLAIASAARIQQELDELRSTGQRTLFL